LAEVNEQRKKQLAQQLDKDVKEREALEKKRGRWRSYHRRSSSSGCVLINGGGGGGVDQLLKYRMYLETTVEASDGEYEEIGDILNRYATLVDTNKDLKNQVRGTEVDVRRAPGGERAWRKIRTACSCVYARRINCDRRSDSSKSRRRTSCWSRTAASMGTAVQAIAVDLAQWLTLMDVAIRYQQHLEGLRTEAMKLDLDRQRSDRISNDRTRESGQIIMTVTNLYNRCRLSLGDKFPVLREQDMDVGQYMQSLLKVIAARIMDLDYILSSYKEQVRHAQRAWRLRRWRWADAISIAYDVL
jgi:hypothetical protein